jgi:hypothetical protein
MYASPRAPPVSLVRLWPVPMAHGSDYLTHARPRSPMDTVRSILDAVGKVKRLSEFDITAVGFGLWPSMYTKPFFVTIWSLTVFHSALCVLFTHHSPNSFVYDTRDIVFAILGMWMTLCDPSFSWRDCDPVTSTLVIMGQVISLIFSWT